jgi:transposase
MSEFLSEDEKTSLKYLHKHERDKRVCDRIKAVLLCNEGRTLREIAHILLLDDQTVLNHINEYKAQQKLHPAHKGSEEKLDQEQTIALRDHLFERTYLFVKDIVAYVAATWGVLYTISGMTRWLHIHGFTYKKPVIVPGKADKALQELWIKAYEELKKLLKPDETICFMDGVHPTHNTKPHWGWIPKGVNKPLATNTGRSRINISGAIDILTKKVFIEENPMLNTESSIHFLKKIESCYPNMSKIYLFCDNARYYKNKEVLAYVASSKIEMRFLPPYSPNLNPIERLWKFMHEKVLYNRYYSNFRDFRDAVLGFLSGLNDELNPFKEALKTRVRDRFHAINGLST